MQVRMRPMRAADERAARAAHAELQHDGFSFLLDWDPRSPWTRYLEQLENRRRGVRLPANRVPSTFLVAMLGDELVGRVSIRHELNEFLANLGGHIGYAVRPAHRRRGFAGEILRQALIVARSLGVEEVLVTCDEDHSASITVIERAGGELEDVRADPGGAATRRYWFR